MMPTLLTPAELAAHLRVSERTVARMVIDGCPNLLVGSRRRFELAAVLSWLTGRTTGARSAVGQARAPQPSNAFTDTTRCARLRVLPGASKTG